MEQHWTETLLTLVTGGGLLKIGDWVLRGRAQARAAKKADLMQPQTELQALHSSRLFWMKNTADTRGDAAAKGIALATIDTDKDPYKLWLDKQGDQTWQTPPPSS